MRERTTWSRQKIASQLRRVAEDPRAMNQDHLQQQPAADAYEIGGPSEFAEDLSPSGPGWKADLDGEGNTKRDEIGLPQFRGDTFNKSDKAPGVSPSRQASIQEIHAKAEVAAKVARLMLSKTASEVAVENQAIVLMDLPLANLQNTLQRLAQDQQAEDDDEDDDGQQKQAAQDSDADDDEDEGEKKQAGELPKEFLENIQKKKDEAKDKKDDDKGDKKEASTRRKAQQQDDDEDDGQQKQAKSRKAQQQDDDEGQDKQAKSRKAQQQDDDEGQDKQAKSRKAQQQQDDGDDDGQQKQARRVKAQGQQQDEDESQQKQAQQQDSDEEKQVGKEAYVLIKKAATDLLALPQASRAPVFKAMLPSLAKVAAYGMEQQGQQQLGTDQIMSQVQQMVQQAMQQQQGQQQAPQVQQQMADQQLVDQMLQEDPVMGEDQIQMDAPDMDLGLGGDEDPALQAIFASDAEVIRAMEARDIERGHQPTASRTASTRTVGTRPSAGVTHLGGGTSTGGSPSGTEEIDRLAGMWSSAPDVSNVFRS